MFFFITIQFDLSYKVPFKCYIQNNKTCLITLFANKAGLLFFYKFFLIQFVNNMTFLRNFSILFLLLFNLIKAMKYLHNAIFENYLFAVQNIFNNAYISCESYSNSIFFCLCICLQFNSISRKSHSCMVTSEIYSSFQETFLIFICFIFD